MEPRFVRIGREKHAKMILRDMNPAVFPRAVFVRHKILLGVVRFQYLQRAIGMTPHILISGPNDLQNSLGEITQGREADFILIDGDPTANISDIRRVEWVIKNIRLYQPKNFWKHRGGSIFLLDLYGKVNRE